MRQINNKNGIIGNVLVFVMLLVSYSSCQSQSNLLNSVRISDANVSNVYLNTSVDDLTIAFGAPDSIIKNSSYGNPDSLDFEIDETEIYYQYHYGDNLFLVYDNKVYGFELNSGSFSFGTLSVGDSSTKLEQQFSKSFAKRANIDDGQLIKVQIETSQGNLSDDYILFIINSGKIIRISSFKEI